MTRLLATTSILAALISTPAMAQFGNPAFAAPDTPYNPDQMHLTNTSDQVFIIEATKGGLAEVEFGKLAEQKGGDNLVKEFARRMVEDHSKANQKLAALAQGDGIKLPTGLDPEHTLMREELQKLSGTAFDRAYVMGQITDHQKTVQLFEYEINSGQNGDLKMFASETLPIILRHLQMAQNIATSLFGVAPQGAAPIAMSGEKAGTSGGDTNP
jgi:putative membrane protein